jgi:hypothetical protein
LADFDRKFRQFFPQKFDDFFPTKFFLFFYLKILSFGTKLVSLLAAKNGFFELQTIFKSAINF